MAERYLRNANEARIVEASIPVILARLKAGYLKPGGHQNEAYENADRAMLETYLNRGTK